MHEHADVVDVGLGRLAFGPETREVEDRGHFPTIRWIDYQNMHCNLGSVKKRKKFRDIQNFSFNLMSKLLEVTNICFLLGV